MDQDEHLLDPLRLKQIRKCTAATTGMLERLHCDILAACTTLLRRDRYFILEAAVIVANARKLRQHIQWDNVVKWLEEDFKQLLAPHHRASLRRMAKSADCPLKVTKDVVKFLETGNGNQTAGYGFLGWPTRQTTERQIEARHHVADGMHQSADRLQVSLQRSVLFEFPRTAEQERGDAN